MLLEVVTDTAIISHRISLVPPDLMSKQTISVKLEYSYPAYHNLLPKTVTRSCRLPWRQYSPHGLSIQLQLTMEVEAVTHALRWFTSCRDSDSQTTQFILFTASQLVQKEISGTVSPDRNVSMVDIQLRILVWTYCPGHAGVKRNDRADRLAGKATLTSGLLLGRSEVLRSLRHYLRARANDITPSIAWRREAWKEKALDGLPWKDEGGLSSVRRTVELCQRQRWVNFWETGWSTYGLFRAHRYHLELNWTVTNSAMTGHRTLFY